LVFVELYTTEGEVFWHNKCPISYGSGRPHTLQEGVTEQTKHSLYN
jgi:hypothetical protein